MRSFTATLESISPYGQSHYHGIPKEDKENSADYEARTWRERMHTDTKGRVFIPPMAFKNCLRDAAKFLSIQIPGKGKATYTKHFKSGVLVTNPLQLEVKKDDVPGVWLFLPADGVTGSGKRVLKCFGRIDHWAGDVTFTILDDTITRDVFVDHLEQAGHFIGIGFFRPQNGGYWGRFAVKDVKGE